MSTSETPCTSLEANPPTVVLPWIVWGLGCLFYFYECLLQVSPSVMSNEIMSDFHVTGSALGILAGVYFYSYAAMQIPGGVMLDYFGPKRLLTIATTICALATLAFGMTDSFFMASVARLMIGFGSAFAAIGTMKLAANWFPAERFALLTGLMVTLGMLGAVGGEAPLALLIDNFGWRHSMMILGVIGLLIALFMLVVASDAPAHRPVQSISEQDDVKLIPSLLRLMRKKQLWLIATYGGLMYMSTPVFGGLWGVPFLMLKLGITKTEAAKMVSLIFIGWAVASPLWGLFSNAIGRRKPPMYIGACIALLCMTLIIYMPYNNIYAYEFLLFVFGIGSAGFLPAFTMARELCSKDYVATGLSFMNMMNMIGIALVQPLIGFILDKHWLGVLNHGMRIYNLNAYHHSLVVMPLAILVALLLLPKVKETYCRSVDE